MRSAREGILSDVCNARPRALLYPSGVAIIRWVTSTRAHARDSCGDSYARASNQYATRHTGSIAAFDPLQIDDEARNTLILERTNATLGGRTFLNGRYY
jgi:hypothetical protein